MFSEFTTQLRSFEDTDKYHQNSNEDNVMKLTNSFSKMSNEVSCLKCNRKGHVAKICQNNFKKNKKWCNYCKRQTHVRESCRYKKRNTMKAATEEDCSFVFKINDRPQRTVESKRIMVDTGATSHIIRVIERLKNFDDSFQPDNLFIELADGTKTNGVALRRGDAEICPVNANGNTESVTLKGALFIPSYPQDIFSVKSATANGAAITFKKNKNELIHKNGTKFNIFVHNRLYYLMSTTNKSEDCCQGCYDINTWYRILGHCNYDDIRELPNVVKGMKIKEKNWYS